jgi:tetratricopeptide (TPR) repeat protein
MLAARIDRLPVEAKGLLQTVAVLGRDVPVALLGAMAELPDAALHRGLRQLQDAEFLYETRLFPETVYTFKHALTHEVAYGSLLQERRRELHARTVEAIEGLYADRLTEQVERLAHHALRGEVWDKALAYCRRAGEKAMARSAHREAVSYFEQALTALAHLPEHRDTLEQAIDLRCDLRNALLPLGDHAWTLDHLRAAEALAERLGDPQRLGQITARLCIPFLAIGEPRRAMAAGQRALAMAASSGAFDVQIVAQTQLGIASHLAGDFQQALDITRQIRGLLTEEQYLARFDLVSPPAVISRNYLAWSLAELGHFAEGSAVIAELLRLADAVAQPYHMASALIWGGGFYRRQGAFHTAIPMLEQGLALCQAASITQFSPVAVSTLGAAYACVGRTAEALPLLNQMLERIATGSYTIYQGPVLADLSEAYLHVDRVEEARACADRLLDLSRTHTGRGYEAHACRLLGDVAMHREPPDIEDATAHYRQALALAEALGMRPLLAHCHRGLGALYAQMQQRAQAHTELSTAMTLYRALDMPVWLHQTEAVLVRMASGPHRIPS